MNRSAQAISVPKDFKNAWNAKRYRAGKTACDAKGGYQARRRAAQAVRVEWQQEKNPNKFNLEHAATCNGNGNSSNRRPERRVKGNWTRSRHDRLVG